MYGAPACGRAVAAPRAVCVNAPRVARAAGAAPLASRDVGKPGRRRIERAGSSAGQAGPRRHRGPGVEALASRGIGKRSALASCHAGKPLPLANAWPWQTGRLAKANPPSRRSS